MTIRQVTTTYVCDGCSFETTTPHDWRQLSVFGVGNFTLLSGHSLHADHYCSTCVKKMLVAVAERPRAGEVGSTA